MATNDTTSGDEATLFPAEQDRDAARTDSATAPSAEKAPAAEPRTAPQGDAPHDEEGGSHGGADAATLRAGSRGCWRAG